MPYIFIGGCGHSGTTLLLKLLGYHSKIQSPLGMVENNLKMFLPSHPTYQQAKKIHRSREVGIKYSLYKNPSNILHLRTMKVAFPKSKMILMIRDGRDVAISCHKRKLRPTFSDCVKYWRDRTLLTQRYANRKDVLVIRYEDLADQPAEVLGKICQFLELPVEDLVSIYESNLNEELEKPESEKGLTNHKKLRKWQVNQKIERSSRWASEMSDKQKITFTRLAGSVLVSTGYQRQ